jgi:lysophospholipase L1-like esterase
LNLLESNKNDGIISLADIIIISMGSNDLNSIEYEDALSLNINYNDKLKFYKENLQKIIEKIRKINKEAHLAIIGLYDPYAQDEPQKTRFLLEWNYETGLIVNLNYKIAYVPTYEVFKYHLDSYLSADEFHPSGEGYQAIVEEIYDILDY